MKKAITPRMENNNFQLVGFWGGRFGSNWFLILFFFLLLATILFFIYQFRGVVVKVVAYVGTDQI